jgi:hypothetical protein
MERALKFAEHYKNRDILSVRDNGAAAALMIPSFPSARPNWRTLDRHRR